MADSTGQQNTMIKSVKSGLPEEPAPIAVYAATPFNAQDPASSKQPITAAGVEDKTDFKYFQRQVSFFVIPANMTALQRFGKHDSHRYCMMSHATLQLNTNKRQYRRPCWTHTCKACDCITKALHKLLLML